MQLTMKKLLIVIIVFSTYSFCLFSNAAEKTLKLQESANCSEESWNKLRELRNIKISTFTGDSLRKAKERALLTMALNYLKLKDENNIELGVCMLQYLIEIGNSKALNELIRYYVFDKSSNIKAKQLAIKGAIKGNPESQYYLSLLIAEGELIKNLGKEEWLIKSHEGGHLGATCTLGKMLLKSDKLENGVELLKVGAEKNQPRCQFYLALAYLKGVGVVQSDCNAFFWVTKASILNNKNSHLLINNEAKRFEKCMK